MHSHTFVKQYKIRQIAAILAVLWTVLMLYLFVLPMTSLPQVDIKSIDDWFHAVSMFIFSFLWLSAFYKGKKALLVYIFILTALFGLAVEVIQFYFTDTRHFQMKDVVFDMIGALTGIILFRLAVYLYYRS